MRLQNCHLFTWHLEGPNAGQRLCGQPTVPPRLEAEIPAGDKAAQMPVKGPPAEGGLACPSEVPVTGPALAQRRRARSGYSRYWKSLGACQDSA